MDKAICYYISLTQNNTQVTDSLLCPCEIRSQDFSEYPYS